MDLVFGPTSLHFSLLSAEICQCCTVMISIRVFVCMTVIKTFNVYVDLDP